MFKLRKKHLILSITSLVVSIGIWWILTDVLKLTSPTTLPGPFRIMRTFVRKLTDPNPDGATLFGHLNSSLRIALSGYFLGVVIGVPLGIMMAWNKKIDYFVTPLFDLLRPVPGIAWIPLMIIFFGIGLFSKAMVIFLSAFIACVVNSYSGIKSTKPVHIWVGSTFGATSWQLLFKVAIPSALPMIFTGLRVALGASWNALIAAEMLASNRGLGFMIQQARGVYRPDIIIMGMLVIGGIGALLAAIIGFIEKKAIGGKKWY